MGPLDGPNWKLNRVTGMTGTHNNKLHSPCGTGADSTHTRVDPHHIF